MLSQAAQVLVIASVLGVCVDQCVCVSTNWRYRWSVKLMPVRAASQGFGGPIFICAPIF